MITELIALASLAANKPIFEQNKTKFEKHWHPKEILQDIERINPGFYPRPVAEESSPTPNVKSNLVDVKQGFLTKEELVEVHGRCGNLLHAENPYGKKRDYKAYERIVPSWMERIQKLLNCHQVKLFDEDRFYLVHMKEAQDDKVHMYTFVRHDPRSCSDSDQSA